MLMPKYYICVQRACPYLLNSVIADETCQLLQEIPTINAAARNQAPCVTARNDLFFIEIRLNVIYNVECGSRVVSTTHRYWFARCIEGPMKC